MLQSNKPIRCAYNHLSIRESLTLPSQRNRIRNSLDFLSLSLLFAYLIFIPAGMIGLGIVLAGLLLKLLTIRNVESLGVYLLLFGMKTFGLVSIVFGYPGTGGKLAFITGLLILVFCTDFRKNLFNLRLPLFYFMGLLAILYWSYLDGPQTPYCDTKLSQSIIFGILYLITFYYLLHSKSIDWLHLGQLGVFSALVVLAASLIVMPHLTPHSIVDIGAIRIGFGDTDQFEFRNLLGGISILSFVLLLASSPNRYLGFSSLINLVSYSIASFIILAWAGSRLPLFSAIIVIFSILLVKPTYARRYKIIIGIMTVFIICLTGYAISKQLGFITSALDSTQSISQRSNRSINWEAGYRRFSEKPIFGHGLGGYYIEHFSYPGEGTYPHNLLLELLCETGLVRTLLILLPLILMRNPLVTYRLDNKSASGGAIFPLLLMLFLQSMVSYDLRANIGLFSMIGAIIGATKKPSRKGSRKHPLSQTQQH